MCEKTGIEMFSHLVKMAKDSHFRGFSPEDVDNDWDPSLPKTRSSRTVAQLSECFETALYKIDRLNK